MRTTRNVLFATTLAVAAPIALPAQQHANDPRLPAHTERAGIAGPRFGITVLSAGVRSKLKADEDVKLNPVITQFGWEFEKQFLGDTALVTPVSEIVLLVGGLDQGKVLPSVTWLVGLRSVRGAEFGVGPNLTPVGVALAVAVGVTMHRGSVNIPLNIAYVPSSSGTRVSMLTGFTLR